MTTGNLGMPLRIALIDDEKPVRSSLQTLFEGEAGFIWAGSYPGVGPALDGLRENPADVVLLDLRMPGIDGINGISLIREVLPDAEVVVLTLFEEEDDIFAALRAGATGYLLKREHPDRLLRALADVSTGGTPMSPAIARRVLAEFRERGPDPTGDTLSHQESRILESLRSGLAYKQVAAERGISIDTVRTYVKRIYRKLRVNSLAQAIDRVQPVTRLSRRNEPRKR